MATQVQLPPPDGFQLGGTSNFKPDINLRRLHAIILQVLGTGPNNPNGGVPNVASWVENIQLLQDDKVKQLFYPQLSRRYDHITNTTQDPQPYDMFYLPLSRPGLVNSFWGTGDIKQVQIAVKFAPGPVANETCTGIRGWIAYSPVDAPEPRGPVMLQTAITPAVPVAGWNEISDLPVKGIVGASMLILGSAAITEVEVYAGERLAYKMTSAAAYVALSRSPRYLAPDGYAFYAIFDGQGYPGELLKLVENGVRRPLSVRYYWDTNIAAVAPFQILAEGLEDGAQQPAIKAA